MLKIKKEDEVIVIAGRDKGRRGKVRQVLSKGERYIVSGINIVQKHVKANPQKNIAGGIVKKEASIHVSNIALYNSETQKASKVGFKLDDSGKKERFFKDTGKVVTAA